MALSSVVITRQVKDKAVEKASILNENDKIWSVLFH